METIYNLNRFLEAQETIYNGALTEIKKGKKQSHWMWFVFPQIAGLGFTDYNMFYAIKNLEEATQYIRHPVLGKRLLKFHQLFWKLTIKQQTKSLENLMTENYSHA